MTPEERFDNAHLCCSDIKNGRACCHCMIQAIREAAADARDNALEEAMNMILGMSAGSPATECMHRIRALKGAKG